LFSRRRLAAEQEAGDDERGGHPELRAADAAPVAEQQPNQIGSLYDRLEAIE
jgi:hypothetical protein